jgi:hypothetical protein
MFLNTAIPYRKSTIEIFYKMMNVTEYFVPL